MNLKLLNEFYVLVLSQILASFLLFFFSDVLDKTVGDKRHCVTAELEVRPRLGERATTKPAIQYAASVLEVLPKELQEAVENGIMNSCIQGKGSATTAILV